MTNGQTAAEDQWYEAYAQVYSALPARAHVACPNCGEYTLRVAFTGPRGGRTGFVSFWCDNCLYGMHWSRASVPYGVDLIPIDLSPEEHELLVPNYRLVNARPN